MAKLTFKRREKKFLVSFEQYKSIIHELLDRGMEYDGYCAGGNTYRLYNIYFDSDTNRIIRSSVQHPKFKEKLRLRAYFLPRSDDDPVFLEIKRKIKGTVVKRRAAMSYGEAKEFIHCGCRPKTDDYMVNQVLDEIEVYLKVYDVKPKVYLSYERVALFSRTDPDFRVTFDGNIISRRDRLDLFCEDRGESLLDDGELVMETKFSGAIPAWFCDILSKNKVYMSGFSKYGNEYTRYRGSDFLHLKDRPAPPIPRIGADKQIQ